MTALPTRPTKDALWGDTSTNITEPTTGKKHAGWDVVDDPPASFFNWWQNLTYQWQAWSRDAIDALNSGKLDKVVGAATVLGNTNAGDLTIGALVTPIGGIFATALVTAGVDIQAAGLLQMSMGALVTGVLAPRESASTLGDATHLWTAFMDVLHVANVSVSGDIVPSGSGGNLGFSGHRFAAYLSSVDLSGPLTTTGPIIDANSVLTLGSSTTGLGNDVVVNPSGAGTAAVEIDLPAAQNTRSFFNFVGTDATAKCIQDASAITHAGTGDKAIRVMVNGSPMFLRAYSAA